MHIFCMNINNLKPEISRLVTEQFFDDIFLCFTQNYVGEKIISSSTLKRLIFLSTRSHYCFQLFIIIISRLLDCVEGFNFFFWRYSNTNKTNVVRNSWKNPRWKRCKCSQIIVLCLLRTLQSLNSFVLGSSVSNYICGISYC